MTQPLPPSPSGDSLSNLVGERIDIECAGVRCTLTVTKVVVETSAHGNPIMVGLREGRLEGVITPRN